MAGNRSVGRPPNNTSRMEPRQVPVAHDRPRINDERKVRPHSAGDPAMGIRPSGGTQKEPKKPRLNTDYMQLRDVPIETMTEAELAELWNPFASAYNTRNPSFPISGDAIGWHFGQNGITISHVKDGNITGTPKLIPSFQSLTDEMRQANREYYKAKGERYDLQHNPRRVAADAATQYARDNNIIPIKMGELGREIPFNHPGTGGPQPTPAANPGGHNQMWPPGGGSPGPTPPATAGPTPGPTPTPAAVPPSGSPGPTPPTGGPGPTPTAGPTMRRGLPGGPSRRPPAPTPQNVSGGLTAIEKANFLKMVDPAKYSDASLRTMTPWQIEQAYNKLRKSIRGAGGVRENKMNEAWRMRAAREESPMTIRAALQQIKAMGMVAKWDREWEEFIVNFPGGSERTAYHTDDSNDAVGTAKSMYDEMRRQGGTGMQEAYPDTSFERDEPSHESRIGNLGSRGHMEDPSIPYSNREFAQFRDLHIEKIHEVADQEIAEMIENTMMDLGLAEEMQGYDEDEAPDVMISPKRDTAMVHQGHIYRDKGHGVYTKSRPLVSRHPANRMQQGESAIPRIRRRWVGERKGHLPEPTHPLPRNIAGSGKNFQVKPGTNKSKKQTGNLVGSDNVTKVKPGFIG